MPLIEVLNQDDIKSLLKLSITNQKDVYDRLGDCTPLFKELFQSTIDKYPELLADWKDFIEKKCSRNWTDFEELKELIESK